MSTPERLHVLIYEYVEDVVSKRAPFRAEHLELVAREKEAGRLLLAGAIGDPPHGAHFVFRADASAAERFADDDPYVANGIVTGRRVEPWMVV